MYVLYIFRCSCAAFGRNKLMIDNDDDDDIQFYKIIEISGHIVFSLMTFNPLRLF